MTALKQYKQVMAATHYMLNNGAVMLHVGQATILLKTIIIKDNCLNGGNVGDSKATLH